MFVVALIAAIVGSIFTSIGKSTESVSFQLCGGIICLVSGILFIANIFLVL